jgi:hypothetical protein
VGPEHSVSWDGSKKLYGSMPCLHIKLLVRQAAIMIRVMGGGASIRMQPGVSASVNNSDERRRCEHAVSLGQDQILSRLPDLAPRRLE